MPEPPIKSIEWYWLSKPILQAYSLGLLSTTTAPTLSLLLSTARGSLRLRDAAIRISQVVQRQLALEQFPATCAIIIGGTTLLPRLFWTIWRRLLDKSSARWQAILGVDALVKFSAAFVSALVSFTLLNRYRSRELSTKRATGLSESPFEESEIDSQNQQTRRSRRRSSVTFGTQGAIRRDPLPPFSGLAGRTLDLTFFALVRALDISISWAWESHKSRRQCVGHPDAKRTSYIEKLAGPSVFALSSSLVMWAWFYSPDRLPRTYNTWIASVAQIDVRLIEALRQCRYGNFVYGKDTGVAPLLQGMCRDLKYPVEWGDPAKTIPVPCELYHSGTGSSCEWHAIVRFTRAWKFAMQMYLPLNLVMLLRRKASKRSVNRAFLEASQSSAFLGAFVALFYYGVCSARTRIGPNLFSKKTVSPMMWDGGLCIGTGCLACGWSILLEKASRRQEITFFVAPRAIATVFPRRYDRKHMWREQLAFALSLATILTTAQLRPEKVRGVFGRLMAQIFPCDL